MNNVYYSSCASSAKLDLRQTTSAFNVIYRLLVVIGDPLLVVNSDPLSITPTFTTLNPIISLIRTASLSLSHSMLTQQRSRASSIRLFESVEIPALVPGCVPKVPKKTQRSLGTHPLSHQDTRTFNFIAEFFSSNVQSSTNADRENNQHFPFPFPQTSCKCNFLP
jgi:hypothetical protein